MDFQLRFEKTLELLREKVGVIFNEDNVDDFETHITEFSQLDLDSLESRISLLFAMLSNINNLNVDQIETDTHGILDVFVIKEYKFSITNELAQLTSILISRYQNQLFSIESQEQFDLFATILERVDEHVTEKKMTDRQAGALLIEMLKKHLFKIE